MESCSPLLVAETAVPAPAPASAPIPAALPPPAIPPMSAPSPAPPKTFLAVFEPSPPPRIEKSLVRSGNDVPLITMSVSSKVSCELPDIRPAEDADINWPNTVDPRGATTLLSTWRLVSRLAVNRNPALCLFVSIESTVRTRTRVPAGTVTLFCGAEEAAANPRITVVAKRIAFVILFSLSRELGTPSDERQGGVHLKKPGGSDATQRLFDAVVILCEQLGAHFPMLHCVLCQFMGLLIRQLTI